MPTKPKKEEEIGSLSEKESRTMIQNLENKMEVQINNLEIGLRRCKKCLART